MFKDTLYIVEYYSISYEKHYFKENTFYLGTTTFYKNNIQDEEKYISNDYYTLSDKTEHYKNIITLIYLLITKERCK